MKKVIFFALLALSIIGTGCVEWIDWDDNGGHSGGDHFEGISPCDSGDDIHLDSLPQAILDYLNTEFTNIEIDDAEVFYDEDDANRTTLEKCLYQDNEELCEELFSPGRRTLSAQEYMLANKADAALKLLEDGVDRLVVPDYIIQALRWIRE